MVTSQGPEAAATAAVVLALAGVRVGHAVLDLGAGSRLVARAAAAAAGRTGRVVSCDDRDVVLLRPGEPVAAAPMSGLAPVVRVASRPEHLPVPSASFDTLLCAATGHWGLRTVLGELRRAGRPGARLVAGVRADAVQQSGADLAGAGFAIVHVDEEVCAGLRYVVARRGR